MSQRLIVAIGIAGSVGVALLVALNILTAFQRGPTATPVTGTSLSPSASIRPTTTATPPPGSTTGTASLSPSATGPGTSASIAPGNLEPNQSPGTLTLKITAPEAVELTSPTKCEWAADQPLRVEQVVTVQDTPLKIHGEPVALEVRTAPVAGPGGERRPFLIRRLATTGTQQRAAYGFSSTAEGDATYDVPGDGTTGTMTFAGLGTAAPTVPADQLPVDRSIYGRPFGDDPKWEHIAASLTWQCDSAPAAFEPPAAVPSRPPDDPSALHIPGVSLGFGGKAPRAGTPLCLEAGTSRDGENTGGEECGSVWVAPDDLPPLVTVGRNSRLSVDPEAGWRISGFSIRASLVSDVEATLGKPKSSILLFRGKVPSPVRTIGFRAPGKGTWIVRATLETEGPGSATSRSTWFFLVRVT